MYVFYRVCTDTEFLLYMLLSKFSANGIPYVYCKVFLFLCQEGISKAFIRRLKPWAGFAKICQTFSALLRTNMDWIAKMEFYQPAFKACCRQEKAALGL